MKQNSHEYDATCFITDITQNVLEPISAKMLTNMMQNADEYEAKCFITDIRQMLYNRY